jgi:riboflavin synthase
MFTGLIQDIGEVTQIKSNAEGKEFTIKTGLTEDIQVDDSIATNGVCLTATKVNEGTYTAQAVHVTLQKTNIGDLKVGSPVNLELALRPMDRLGGHLVQGHVGGLAKLKQVSPKGDNYELTFQVLDKNLLKYMILEGSIAIDGISLTIAKLDGDMMTISIIPHTWTKTILSRKKIGETVNIEVDMMAKYLENFIKFGSSDERLLNLVKGMHAGSN